MHDLVISLVTYNSEMYLQSCLESIFSQTFKDYELILFDNASVDGTRNSIMRLAPHARRIFSEKNIGFAGAHNEVIRTTCSSYVCVLNPDLVLEPDYLERCIAECEMRPALGSVTGLLIRVPALTGTAPRDTIDSYGLVVSKTGRAANAGEGVPVSALCAPRRIMGVPATAAVYRRSALDDSALDRSTVRDGSDTEYFDEDFFMYKEDVDLALRLRLRGWDASAVLEARAYHVRSTSPALFKRPSPLINQWSYRNHFSILIKDVEARTWARWGFLIVLYELAKFFYLACFERSTLTALADVWKNRKKMLAKRSSIMRRRTPPRTLTPPAEPDRA
ncbi:glycosyltransferase family 2 protein [Candidatus Uhrbacteria bacterium]|nr:glycosyltransferase family 2 protein [Candidatus Uhrbacteria bacterium]